MGTQKAMGWFGTDWNCPLAIESTHAPANALKMMNYIKHFHAKKYGLLKRERGGTNKIKKLKV